MATGCLFVDGAVRPAFALVRAVRFAERLRGLLGTDALAPDRGLWIVPCGSIHTIGMRYPIDVVFVDRDGTIVRTVETLVAGRFAFERRSKSVVELAAGGVSRHGLAVGQRLAWSDAPAGRLLPLTAGSLRDRRTSQATA